MLHVTTLLFLSQPHKWCWRPLKGTFVPQPRDTGGVTCACTNDGPVKHKSIPLLYFNVFLRCCPCLCLCPFRQRRQTSLFVMINPTTSHHKPNGSFIGFICFPVFQNCFDLRNVMFVLCEITKKLLAASSATFHIPVNTSVHFSVYFSDDESAPNPNLKGFLSRRLPGNYTN